MKAALCRRTSVAVLAVLCLVPAGAARAADSRDEKPARISTAAPRELYHALNALRVNAAQVYYVRDLQLRRDLVRISFTEGKLAFLAELEGRITGAVFTGRGQVLAVPQTAAERHSMNRFVGMPLLDQGFSRAYLRFTDRTAEDLLGQLRAAETEFSAQLSFAREWDTVVADLNPWHSLRILADWLADEPRPYFYAGLQGDISGAFDVLVDERTEDHVLIGQSRWTGGVRFYDVWTALPHSDVPSSSLANFAPRGYTVNTSIHPDLTLEGETWMDIRTLRGGERMLALQLSRYLAAQQVTDAEGRPLDFFQNEDLSREELRQRGNDALFVVLPAASRAEETFRLRVSYRGRVISDAGNNVFFVGERGSWYPQIAGAGYFVPIELSFRWPRRMTLVATGRKLEEREEGDWRHARWRSTAPVPVAGFNLGEFAQETVTSGPVRIELYANRHLERAVFERFQRPVLLPTMPRFPPSSRQPPPPLPRVMLPEAPPPSPAALMKPLGQEMGEAIRFFEKLLGPFPFEKLAITQIPGSFGQGWPGLLYLSTLSFLTEDQQQRAGIGARVRAHFAEVVPFHEAAHQWWGNTIGWATYRDQWIHEGLANYLALLFLESRHAESLRPWLDDYRADLTTPAPEEVTTSDDAGPLVLGYRLRSSRSPAAYTNVVYGKGTWVFHMLRQLMREPGAKDPDARFARLLRGLAENYRHKPFSTEDLEREIERMMTKQMDLEGSGSMDWFFDQWVRATGIPRYSVEFDVRPRGQQFVVRGKLKQRGVPEPFVAAVPLYAPRSGAKPLLLGRVITSGAETHFEFTLGFRPRRILIDPEATTLCVVE
jgi:hypothetical protein